ncbi:MAG: peptidoglycan-binding protein [Firmicutes bacterium HGW-Firmicutes-15]|nr:MAG: peptidoglycan-binding protein [Firmicutes bacterium HGW-Firmicutes-15]
MSLKKASIEVEGSSSKKIEVLFNPSEYSIDSENKYAFHTVSSDPITQFISGSTSLLSMELFFDTYEAGSDVRNHTKQVSELLDIDSDLHAPPVCKFIWGSLVFRGYMEKVSQRFTMFLDSGIPVRAILSVQMRSYQTVQEKLQAIPLQSSDRTKQRVLKQGEQLWMLAAREYEDPGRWREIAIANDIDNPRLVQTGSKVIVPPLV